MKHSTYKKLYRAHLGAVDVKDLLETRNKEPDPFYQNLIDFIVENNTAVVPFNIKSFTTDFLSGSARQRLDETYFAFILRTAVIIKENFYIRSFRKPESHDVSLAWISFFRSLVSCSLALLYGVQWTLESIFTKLEPTILKIFSEGDALALRRLMVDLGIKLTQEELYPAEIFFEKLNFLQLSQYSPFYWRFLHWMAEAVALRDEDMAFYKREWRNLLKGPFYRTVSCSICIHHFRALLNEYETQLMDENGDLPQLFFTIHNRIHAQKREYNKLLQEPDYTEAQYIADAQFMRQGLSP